MTSPIRAKKSLGQNFLRDPHYITKIADAADIGVEDMVVEIGPGLGHLTRELCSRAKKVLAIELDDRLAEHVRSELAGVRNLEVLHGDALGFDYKSLSGTWKVAANLPYYISTPLIQRLLAARTQFTSLTLMLQKEVAERIAAPPGGREYGFLSVLVQFYSVPKIEFLVPPGAFTPKPGVESAVVTLSIRDRPSATVGDEAFFVQVVKAAFSQRRKTLKNSLRQLESGPEKIGAVFSATGIDLSRRAETLSVEEFARLSEFLLS